MLTHQSTGAVRAHVVESGVMPPHAEAASRPRQDQDWSCRCGRPKSTVGYPRKTGIGIAEGWSAKGAVLLKAQVLRLRRSIFHLESNPGLTAGPIH
jgi:hypothetical protein